MQTASVNTFQIKMTDEVNRQIKSVAAQSGLTKHDFIMRAISEKLNRSKAV